MYKIKRYLHDFILTIAMTAASACVLSLLAFAITVASRGEADIGRIMNAARDALFLSGSLGLFLAAPFLIRKERGARLQYEHQWRAKFRALRPLSVLLLASVGLLFSGVLWDLALF
ncbi:hypothetical protein D3C81_1976770 [compost metagenome]